MASMTIDAFLAALAASPRSWYLKPYRPGDPTSKTRLRIDSPDAEQECPLTHVCRVMRGSEVSGVHKYDEAGEILGLAPADYRALAQAADNHEARAELRARMLAACGLTDPPRPESTEDNA